MIHPRNIVGPVVREIRKEKGLTQAELCAKLNLLGWDISRDTLAKLEAQVRWVADFELLQLAEALRIEPAHLLRQAVKLASKKPPPGESAGGTVSV
jgi:transcriptional regulator with XRE-family HTH domain